MTDKKETLSEKRKELFEIILHQKPTAGRIYRIIKKQDKEFIKKLKEEIERGVKRNNVFPLDWCFDSIDKLAGDDLTK